MESRIRWRSVGKTLQEKTCNVGPTLSHKLPERLSDEQSDVGPKLALVVSLLAPFVLFFFPLDVLDEILDVIESVSEGSLTYSSNVCLTELTTLSQRWPNVVMLSTFCCLLFLFVSLKYL